MNAVEYYGENGCAPMRDVPQDASFDALVRFIKDSARAEGYRGVSYENGCIIFDEGPENVLRHRYGYYVSHNGESPAIYLQFRQRTSAAV